MYSRRSWTLSFDIVDNLTEDAHLMMEQQESTTDCIREILMDFIRANGIVKNYLDIPRKERLERFFGYAAKSGKQSGKIAETPQGKDSEIQPCHHEVSHPDMLTYTTANGTKIHISVEQPA